MMRIHDDFNGISEVNLPKQELKTGKAPEQVLPKNDVGKAATSPDSPGPKLKLEGVQTPAAKI